ncbi:hypothetical protein DH2020_007922 [Rehmannia glutinosa]|uniref:CCHC-type domain-containing protein n=1 Tax=Rehmannia glutinosa TaxID=99300 RepID=A0ABR0TZI9_REHGL
MVNTDAMKVERFLEGLRPELYRDVSMAGTLRVTYSQVAERALNKRQRDDTDRAPIMPPMCRRCGSQHSGVCLAESRTCHTCGKVGHIARMCPRNRNPAGQKVIPARAFTITRADAEANPSVVTGKLPISGVPAFVLFDSGSTHSFASTEYVRRLGRTPDVTEVGYNVMNPSGNSKQTNQILRACSIPIENIELYYDLFVLAMNDYDIILGMDWLLKYGATIDCQKKTVTFQPPEEDPFTFVGITTRFRFPIISALKAQRLLNAGCEGYLVNIMSMNEQHQPVLDEVPIVREYPDVFPDDLPELPPDREIEFVIDLLPGTSPISNVRNFIV